ncbi:MAG: SprT family zinc-dependent metalloprotease [Methylophilus sp.]
MKQQTLKLPNGETISYLLEHRSRKTIGLKITQDGLVVHAPKRIFAYQLNQVLQEKSQWIQNKLALRRANKVETVSWQDGEYLLYLGRYIQLKIQAHTSNKAPMFANDQLLLQTTQVENITLVQRKVVHWYQKQAMLDFGRRLEVFAAKLGVATPPFALSNARSRWGSCNSRGEIRLNWRLLQATPAVINYVICHELAHLKEMNHSAKFYAVLERLFPEHKSVEKELKLLSAQLHRI